MNIASPATPAGCSQCLLIGVGCVDRLAIMRWYAIFTIPRNEKSVARYLQVRGIEHFLPTYETQRRWRNRQLVKVVLPLFPCYLFARVASWRRTQVLECPGVLRMVGNSHGPVPLQDAEVEFLRSDFCRTRMEPYQELAVGQRVRVRSGVMRGVEGILVRKNHSLRFVLTLSLINQQAAVEVSAEDLEPVPA